MQVAVTAACDQAVSLKNRLKTAWFFLKIFPGNIRVTTRIQLHSLHVRQAERTHQDLLLLISLRAAEWMTCSSAPGAVGAAVCDGCQLGHAPPLRSPGDIPGLSWPSWPVCTVVSCHFFCQSSSWPSTERQWVLPESSSSWRIAGPSAGVRDFDPFSKGYLCLSLMLMPNYFLLSHNH